MHVLGIELFELEENKMLYDQIFELKTFEDTENWLKNEFIDPMTDKVNARADAQYKNISDNIIHIIHHEFESELTLDEIARRLHYNPNYLSSIFKKKWVFHSASMSQATDTIWRKAGLPKQTWRSRTLPKS